VTSLALLEIGNLTPALLAADRCAKAAGVEIVGIESADGAPQCIKLAGTAAAVRQAAESAVALARQMGSTATMVVIAGPREETEELSGNRRFSIRYWDFTTRARRANNPCAIQSVTRMLWVCWKHKGW